MLLLTSKRNIFDRFVVKWGYYIVNQLIFMFCKVSKFGSLTVIIPACVETRGNEIQSLENMVFAISCQFSTVCYTVDLFERMNTYGNVNCTQVEELHSNYI